MLLKKAHLEELGRIQERINSLFERAFLQAGYEGGEGEPPGSWSPPVDILETGSAYLLLAELPGISRDDVEVRFEEGALQLSGRLPASPRSWSFLRMERPTGSFQRTFRPAAEVDSAALSVRLERGVLTVILPKERAV